MSLFSDLNAWIASFVPGPFWDYIEIILGLSMMTLPFALRTINPRFRLEGTMCWVDAIMVRLSWVGLVLLGVVGCMVFLDGVFRKDQVPRSFAVVAMIGIVLIHGRTIMLSLLELWPLKNTHWAAKYGADAYYSKEYRWLARKPADPVAAPAYLLDPEKP